MRHVERTHLELVNDLRKRGAIDRIGRPRARQERTQRRRALEAAFGQFGAHVEVQNGLEKIHGHFARLPVLGKCVFARHEHGHGDGPRIDVGGYARDGEKQESQKKKAAAVPFVYGLRSMDSGAQ